MPKKEKIYPINIGGMTIDDGIMVLMSFSALYHAVKELESSGNDVKNEIVSLGCFNKITESITAAFMQQGIDLGSIIDRQYFTN